MIKYVKNSVRLIVIVKSVKAIEFLKLDIFLHSFSPQHDQKVLFDFWYLQEVASIDCSIHQKKLRIYGIWFHKRKASNVLLLICVVSYFFWGGG